MIKKTDEQISIPMVVDVPSSSRRTVPDPGLDGTEGTTANSMG